MPSLVQRILCGATVHLNRFSKRGYFFCNRSVAISVVNSEATTSIASLRSEPRSDLGFPPGKQLAPLTNLLFSGQCETGFGRLTCAVCGLPPRSNIQAG